MWNVQLNRTKSVASRGNLPVERMQELANALSNLDEETLQGKLLIWPRRCPWFVWLVACMKPCLLTCVPCVRQLVCSVRQLDLSSLRGPCCETAEWACAEALANSGGSSLLYWRRTSPWSLS